MQGKLDIRLTNSLLWFKYKKHKHYFLHALLYEEKKTLLKTFSLLRPFKGSIKGLNSKSKSKSEPLINYAIHSSIWHQSAPSKKALDRREFSQSLRGFSLMLRSNFLPQSKNLHVCKLAKICIVRRCEWWVLMHDYLPHIQSNPAFAATPSKQKVDRRSWFGLRCFSWVNSRRATLSAVVEGVKLE